MRTAVLLVTCAALAGMNGLAAQTPPTFEVASVRRNTTGNQQGSGLAGPQPGGRFIAIGATLRLLRESDAACAKEARDFAPAGPGERPGCGDFRMSARSLIARGMFMPALAQALRERVGRQVVDRTGLDKAYDLELEWSSDVGLQQARPGSAGETELTPDGLSMFTALREQLGLRLQPDRGPVDVVVIDSAELPTPN